MFVVSPISVRSSSSSKSDPPAYSSPGRKQSIDKKSAPTAREDLSLVFLRRLATPWQDQQVAHVQFSQDNDFLLALNPWREPTAISNIRKAHDVLVYDLSTGESLYLDRFAPAGSSSYSVGPKGAGIGPSLIEKHERTSSFSSNLGIRSKPKVSTILPLTVCHGQMSSRQDWSPTVDIVDLLKKERRRNTTNVRIQGPLTWSPDGSMLAGLDFTDPTKVSLFQFRTPGFPRKACLPGHLAEITEMAFMPDGKSLVSLASDGVGRLVSTSSSNPGILINSFRAPTARYPATALQVSPDGRTIASIWGRLVVLWYPETNRVMSYEIDSARPGADLFPLAISPACNLLACRCNTGIEVCDLLTGRRRAGVRWKNYGVEFATSATFNSSADRLMLAVGMFNGRVIVYNVTDEAPVELDSVEQPVEVEGVTTPHEVEGGSSKDSIDQSRTSQGSWL